MEHEPKSESPKVRIIVKELEDSGLGLPNMTDIVFDPYNDRYTSLEAILKSAKRDDDLIGNRSLIKSGAPGIGFLLIERHGMTFLIAKVRVNPEKAVLCLLRDTEIDPLE